MTKYVSSAYYSLYRNKKIYFQLHKQGHNKYINRCIAKRGYDFQAQHYH